MPETTKFVAEGVGNGFYRCPYTLAVEPVDGILPISISDYNSLYGSDFGFLSSDWGNFSSGVSSLGDLMDMYYNLYSFNMTATGEWTIGSNTDSNTWTGELEQIVEKEPMERVCGSTPPIFRYDGVSSFDYGTFRLVVFPFVFDDGAGNKTYYLGLQRSQSFFRNTGVTSFIARNFEAVDDGLELTHHEITISGLTFHFSFSASTTPDSYSSTLTVNSETPYTYPA